MPLFGNTSKESLILQENRLTRIEATVQETRTEELTYVRSVT